MALKAEKGGGRPFGWHSGELTCKNIYCLGDLTIQDDIIFGDCSAGNLSVTGGIDMQDTTSAIGIDMGGTYSTAAINIDGTTPDGIKISLTDAEGGYEGILIDNTFTKVGAVAHKAIFSKVTYTPATAGTACPIAIEGQVFLNGDLTEANNYNGYGWGVQGRIHVVDETTIAFTGDYDPGAVYAGLRGVMTDGGTSSTYTDGTLTALYAESQLSQNAASGTFRVFLAWLRCQGSGTSTDIDAALYIDSGDAWDNNITVGVDINDSVTGIDIGACTTGINLSSTATTGINLNDSCTTAIDIGACTTGIDFTGTISSSGIDFTGVTVTQAENRDNSYITMGHYGSSRTPIVISALTYSFAPIQCHWDIQNDGDSDASFRPIWVWTEISTNDQAHTSVYGFMHYVDVQKDVEDLYGAMHQIVVTTGADSTVAAREIHGIQGTIEISTGKTLDISGSAAMSAINGSIKGTGDVGSGDKIYCLQASIEAAVGSSGTVGGLYLYCPSNHDHAIGVQIGDVTVGDGLMYINDPNDKALVTTHPATEAGGIKIKVTDSNGTETRYIKLYSASGA